MAVDVKAGATFEAGDPKMLFPTRMKSASASREYDLTSDGRRFLVNSMVSEESIAPITLLQNWMAELKR
jgi:hypothetical protein